jgi:hypothetical protein
MREGKDKEESICPGDLRKETSVSSTMDKKITYNKSKPL